MGEAAFVFAVEEKDISSHSMVGVLLGHVYVQVKAVLTAEESEKGAVRNVPVQVIARRLHRRAEADEE